MSLLIFGAGFLGQRIARAIPGARITTADICDAHRVAAELALHRPEVVLNAAGKTGEPNVDWCESHPVETARSNTVGPLVLAECCRAQGLYLLHLGSGCIFYGPSPDPRGWREDDFANPASTYSRSKYAADLLLTRFPGVGIVRLRMPIDHQPGPRNLITRLAKYSKVIDVENSVSVVDDLVQVVAQLAERRATGVFHATNPGTMKHRELLALYKSRVDPSHACTFISDGELVQQGLAVRPRSNCILQSARLEALGIHMRPIDEALAEVMTGYAEAAREAPGTTR